MNCKHCNSKISENKKFCNRSCAATYNNTHRIVSDETKKKLSETMKNKPIVSHPYLTEILNDHNDGMLLQEICRKYKIGGRRLRNILKEHNVYKLKTNKEKICDIHDVQYSYAPSGGYRCKKCDVERVTKEKQQLKIKAVEYKGGKCVQCGYNKSMAALEFHHIDPNIKEQNIAKYSTRQWDAVKVELDKCILVCANCHREIHENIRKST